MGRSGSSSKRKSSKKKSFKISSEARRKKKSRRNKSKKLSRSDDSVSSYSDDESTSSSLVSSSSFESDYKSKRARSRTHGDVKGSRKRIRRRSSSPESNDSHRVKKRKRSKRKDDSEARKKGEKKKKNKKKKPRRDANISSESCSTCQGGDSSSDEEREIESLRGRSRENKKANRESSKGRSGNRKNRSRSSSYSKLSDCDENNSIEKLAVENNPRRLRSVITVANQQEEKEEYEVNKDELKEEFVYDYDDYPSCRSNDSNDGGNKRELADPSYISSEKRRRVENVMEEVDSVSNIKAAQTKAIVPVNVKEKESNASAAVESDANDLESILRQKALENLSRFRGLQTKAVVTINEKIGVKQLPTATVDLVQSKLPKQDGSSMISAPQSVVLRSRFTWRRDPSVASKTEENIPKGSGCDSETAKHTAPHLPDDAPRLPDEAGISGGSEEKEHRSESSRSQAPERKLRTFPRATSSLIGSAVNKSADETSKTVTEINRSQAPERKVLTFPRANSTLTDSEVNKSADEKSKTAAEINSNKDGVGISDAHRSTALERPSSVSAEQNSSREQQQTETKDSSQFEQKTMSVMRGGEMVQVSYKVYIPKKAPALARRKLKR